MGRRSANPLPIKYGKTEPMQKYNFVKTDSPYSWLNSINHLKGIPNPPQFPFNNNKEISSLEAVWNENQGQVC